MGVVGRVGPSSAQDVWALAFIWACERWLNIFKPLIHLAFNHPERSPPAADGVEGPFVLRLGLRLRLSPTCPARVVQLGGDSPVEPEFEAVLFLPLADEIAP